MDSPYVAVAIWAFVILVGLPFAIWSERRWVMVAPVKTGKDERGAADIFQLAVLGSLLVILLAIYLAPDRGVGVVQLAAGTIALGWVIAAVFKAMSWADNRLTDTQDPEVPREILRSLSSDPYA